MEPVTKADLKDLLKELKDDIKQMVAAEFSAWKPTVDTQLAELQSAVDLLQQHVYHNKSIDAEEASGADLTGPSARKNKSSLGDRPAQEAPRANDHGVASSPRTVVDGANLASSAPPANGTIDPQFLFQPGVPLLPSSGSGNLGQFCRKYAHNPPSMPFPLFDGENPHLWKDLCE